MQKAKKINRFVMKCMIALLFFTISVDIVQAAENDTVMQKEQRPVADGIYKLVSAVNNDYVWDIDQGSTEDGANLQLYKDNGSDAQKFLFTYLADGYYLIVNVNSNKAVGCSEDGSDTNMKQEEAADKDTQCWKLTYTENDYYTITCKSNGLVADAAGGFAENNTNMQVYQANYTAAQEFRLVKISSEDVLGSSKVYPEYPRVFYYVLTFLVVGIEAVAVIFIGRCSIIIKNRKGKMQEGKIDN